MQHAVHRRFHSERPADIPLAKLKRGIAVEVRQIARVPGHKVVVADDVVTFGDQTVAQMGADEAGRP